MRAFWVVLVCLASAATVSPMTSEPEFCRVDETKVNPVRQHQPNKQLRFGWSALIKLNGAPICSASIVHERHVLTVAHCFGLNMTNSEITNYTVQLGIQFNGPQNPLLPKLVYKIEKIIIHPNYACPDVNDEECCFAFDVAIVRLKENIDFNSESSRLFNSKPIGILNDIVSTHDFKVSGFSTTQMRPSLPSFVDPQSFLQATKVEITNKIIPIFGASLANYRFIQGMVGDAGSSLIAINRETGQVGLIGIVLSLIIDDRSYFIPTVNYRGWIQEEIQDVDVNYKGVYHDNMAHGRLFMNSAFVNRCDLQPEEKSMDLKATPRIGDGQPAGLTEFPWFAALVSSYGSVRCGGSIIDERHILTAAHCLKHQFNASHHKIALGKMKAYDRTQRELRYNIESFIVHDKYHSCDEGLMQSECPAANDIAIIRLDRSIQFRQGEGEVPPVEPIGLISSGGRVESGQTLQVCGFGLISNYPESYVEAKKLMKASIVSLQCPDPMMNKFYICADGKAGVPRVLSGDSGGGLVRLVDGFRDKYELVGIVSSGDPQLTYYTNVSLHLPWIEKKIGHKLNNDNN